MSKEKHVTFKDFTLQKEGVSIFTEECVITSDIVPRQLEGRKCHLLEWHLRPSNRQ